MKYLVYIIKGKLSKEAYPEANPPTEKEIAELKKILKARIFLGETTHDNKLSIIKQL